MKKLAFLLLLAGTNLRLTAQTEPVRQPTIFEKLTATEGVELTLEADFTTFVSQKKTNNYLPGTLRLKDGKSYSVELRPRGRYRRKVSEIPPVKIRFSEKELRAEGLDSLNEIKIALPAFHSDEGNELLVKEYLAYRMFEKISAAHFRAGLVKLTLVDTNDKKPGKKEVYAIFIEDEEDVAQRLGGTPEEEYGVQSAKMEQQQTAAVVIFEYVIGNTDWDFSMHRNVQLIKMNDGKILPLPYDFDFSGLVGAPYASPSSESGLSHVRERFLMSAGLNPEALKEATKLLKSKEKEFYEICRSKFLSSAARRDAVKFLGTFFKNMNGKDDAPLTMKWDKE